MQPVSFHSREKPIGLDKPLPVVSGKDVDGNRVQLSCWELTPEELERVALTGRVYVVVLGDQQPAMYLKAHPEEVGI